MNEELAKAIEALREGAPDIWAGLAAEHAQANGFLAIVLLALAIVFLVIGLCIRRPVFKWVSEGNSSDCRDVVVGFVGLVLLALVVICIGNGIDSLYDYLQPSVALMGLI